MQRTSPPAGRSTSLVQAPSAKTRIVSKGFGFGAAPGPLVLACSPRLKIRPRASSPGLPRACAPTRPPSRPASVRGLARPPTAPEPTIPNAGRHPAPLHIRSPIAWPSGRSVPTLAQRTLRLPQRCSARSKSPLSEAGPPSRRCPSRPQSMSSFSRHADTDGMAARGGLPMMHGRVC